jgi:hypothetical protein
VIASGEHLFDATNMPEKKAGFSMKIGVTIKNIRDKNVRFGDDQDKNTYRDNKHYGWVTEKISYSKGLTCGSSADLGDTIYEARFSLALRWCGLLLGLRLLDTLLERLHEGPVFISPCLSTHCIVIALAISPMK